MYNLIISLSKMFSLVFSATLTGTVSYGGGTKDRKSIDMDADPICGSSHKVGKA